MITCSSMVLHMLDNYNTVRVVLLLDYLSSASEFYPRIIVTAISLARKRMVEPKDGPRIMIMIASARRTLWLLPRSDGSQFQNNLWSSSSKQPKPREGS